MSDGHPGVSEMNFIAKEAPSDGHLFGSANFFSRNAMKCASDGWPPEMKSITKEASDGHRSNFEVSTLNCRQTIVLRSLFGLVYRLSSYATLSTNFKVLRAPA
jgi:hypothetical protein